MNLESATGASDQALIPHSPLLYQSSVDTAASSPSTASPTSCAAWPAIFRIPCFNYDTELKLQQADLAFSKHGTLLTVIEPKSDILNGLLQKSA